MVLPVLIVSAFPERLPPLIEELKGRKHEIIESPVGRAASIVKPNPYWRDTNAPMLMSWGAVACAEGHLLAWKRVIERGTSCIILEDDAKIVQQPLPIDCRMEGLFYLGARAVGDITVQQNNAVPPPTGWAYAPFCWWTIGYVITPSIAKTLVNQVEAWNNVWIPVDEIIPAHYTGMVSENRLGLIDLEGMKHFSAYIPQTDKPYVMPRGYKSTTDVHDAAFDLKTVVYPTDAERVAYYVKDLENLGHDVHVLGVGNDPFDTSRESVDEKGAIQKLKWLRDAGFNDNDIVLCLDGWDTRVLATPKETLKAYGAMRKPNVISGERAYWPPRCGLQDKFTEGPAPYPCSGLQIGVYKDLKILFDKYDDFNDQAVAQYEVLDQPNKWIIDTESKMFRSLSNDEDNEIAEGTIAYHWNGPSRPAPARWLNPFKEYVVPVADGIYRLNILSKEEAEWLYTALMLEKGWEALPGDTVPGDELRLMGLCAAVDKRMHGIIYPLWQPARWQPIKDLFAIRYSKERQPKIELHNDKSHFSMSILLHREGRGGELCFPRQGYVDTQLSPGQALVWPSAITHPHEVTPTEGSRN